MVITVRSAYIRPMENAANEWFQTAISILTYNRNQRVWSVIVTLFGDLAGAPGDHISGSLLSAIIEPMGIKPEAQRVALHRLRNDGWLASEKAGRSSLYSLTPHGLQQSQAASPRIYARDLDTTGDWQIIIQDTVRTAERHATEKQMRRAGFLIMTPGVYLAPPNTATTNIDGFVMSGNPNSIPDWLKVKTSPPELVKAYADLDDALDKFSTCLDAAPPLSHVQIATLRTVIVHNWRKALLPHPELPASFFVDAWRGHACRRKVMECLDRLGRPELSALRSR